MQARSAAVISPSTASEAGWLTARADIGVRVRLQGAEIDPELTRRGVARELAGRS